MGTGWTWDYVEEQVTLPRYYKLLEHWRLYPPVHVSVASYLGINKQAKQNKDDNTPVPSLVDEFLA